MEDKSIHTLSDSQAAHDGKHITKPVITIHIPYMDSTLGN